VIFLMVFVLGIGVFLGWAICSDHECKAWGESEKSIGPCSCRLPRNHSGRHHFDLLPEQTPYTLTTLREMEQRDKEKREH
jgi:hypothetical protein